MAENGTGGSLERSLGLTASILITIGAVIGSGIFVALGPTIAEAGNGLLVAMILAATVALANGLSSSQLGINYPVSGGTYAFARKVGRPAMGFVAGAAFLGKELIGLSVIALTFASYSARVIEGLPVPVVAAAALLLVTVLNYLGLDLTTRVLIGLTVLKVGLLVLFVAFAFPEADPAELTPIFGDEPLGLLSGAAIFFFAYAGYARLATIAAEVEEPERNIPLGITIGFAVSAVVFLLVGAVTLGVLGVEQAAGVETAVFDAAAAALGDWGGWVVLAAAWIATLSVLVGGILGVSRVAQAMAEQQELPEWLAAIHSEYDTPHRAVLVLGVASAILALLFNLRPLLEITNVFTLTYYAITNFAALQLSSEERTLHRLVSWFGLIGCVALLIALPLTAIGVAAALVAAFVAIRQFLLQ